MALLSLDELTNLSDSNCPQHIQPRFTQAMIDVMTEPLKSRIAELETENQRLGAELGIEIK